MDSLTGFEDDEHFFSSYDVACAEGDRESARSLSPLELELEEPPPGLSTEQLAHASRFRRPVAAVIGALSLLACFALVKSRAPVDLQLAQSTPAAPQAVPAAAELAPQATATAELAPQATAELAPLASPAAVPNPLPSSAPAAPNLTPDIQSNIQSNPAKPESSSVIEKSAAPGPAVPAKIRSKVDRGSFPNINSAGPSTLGRAKSSLTPTLSTNVRANLTETRSGFTSVARFPDLPH